MSSLRILIVEDSKEDAELIVFALKKAGMRIDHHCVQNEEEYLTALNDLPHVILCDYGLPRFSTLRALEIAKARLPDVPFIIVSGHIGDDVAVAMLKAGANDYIFKDDLPRLEPSIKRELREAKARLHQRRLEEVLKIVADALSGVTGKAFLESLVIQLAYATNSECVFIGDFQGKDKKFIQTVATCADGKIISNFPFDISDLSGPNRIFTGTLAKPIAAPALQTLSLQNYLGTLLISSQNKRLGAMVIMYSDALPHPQLAESLLHIYAVRAASELERMEYTAQLEFQATHDPLTELGNRNALQVHMAQMMESLGPDSTGALVLIDLDRFKEINDTLGHQSGDAILKQIGPRLLPLLGENHLLCRIGGDEFAVLVTGTAEREKIEELAVTLLYAIKGSFEVEGINLQVGASAGVALYPEHSRDAQGLLRQADVAMYLAKEEASGYRVYDSAFDFHTRDRLMLMTELRRAIENDELVLHYQPKISLGGGDHPMAMEALVRWQHPERGLLPPGKFVPLAEMTDLIGPLTLWVLDAASTQCKLWREAGYQVNVAINISTRNLLDGKLPEELAEIVRLHGLEHSWLELEITESAIMTDPKRSLAVLQQISDMGHLLSIDDFGTGYSSLAYLTELPVEHLKIDRAFVRQMVRSPRDASIVQSTIGLAHNLDMMVIAEGVEDGETLERLREFNCDQAQGFYICVPKPPTDLEEWMIEHKPSNRSLN